MTLRSVWRGWAYEPSKLDLADALWPALTAKIRAALADERDAPELAEAVFAAHSQARVHSRGSCILGIGDPAD